MQLSADARYRVVRLANGTHSLHSTAHDETFHPVIGPVAEAEALYVKQLRIADRLRQTAEEFVIWDVGLGAAGNALTVLKAVRDIPKAIRLVSFDQTLEPLEVALRHPAELPYVEEYRPIVSKLLTLNGSALEFTDAKLRVAWELHLADFPALLTSPTAEQLPKPHVILFDAYSPATNPAMWTQPLFARIHQLLSPARPCALPTYSRSTMLRVTLLLSGFYVGKGHATGEKEETTIAANALELISEPLDQRWLRRAHNSTSAEPLWDPVYRQAPLSARSRDALHKHAQFT